MVWNLFTFKVILVLGKARSLGVPNLGCRWAESPGWFDVSPKNSAQDVIHEWTHCWWGCQSPVVYSCSLLNHPNIFCGGMLKLHIKSVGDLLLYFLILNATATQYTCSVNGLYHPHWLVQWIRHCSRMYIPVHSPWLPGYINVMQTILII